METLKRILDLSKSRFNKDTEFEKALNLKPKTVDSWKRGNSKTYYQMLPLICSLLSVSSDYLLGLDTEPNRNSPLSEDIQELIDMYSSLPERKQGEVKGFIKGLTETNRKPANNADDDIVVTPKGKFRVAHAAAFGGGTMDILIPADVSYAEINRLIDESEAQQRQEENQKVAEELKEIIKRNK